MLPLSESIMFPSKSIKLALQFTDAELAPPTPVNVMLMSTGPEPTPPSPVIETESITPPFALATGTRASDNRKTTITARRMS